MTAPAPTSTPVAATPSPSAAWTGSTFSSASPVATASSPGTLRSPALPVKVTPGPNPFVVHASQYAAALATEGGGALYTVGKRLQWNDGPSAAFAALDASSVWITGALTDGHGHRVYLQRLDRATLKVRASAKPADLTSSALGSGALWVATGHPNHAGACDCTPAPARLDLLRLDPTTLTVTRTFHLPESPLLVAAAGGTVWVATPDHLLRIDPDSGTVTRTVPLDGYPLAVASSLDGSRLYLSTVSAHDEVGTESGYTTASGALLGRYSGPFVSDATPAVTADGVWIDEEHLVGAAETTMQLLTGPGLHPGPTVPGFGANAQPYAVGGRLWVVDPWSKAGTTCIDAATGQVLGNTPTFANTAGNFQVVIADTAVAFVVRTSGFSEDLAAVTPKLACR